MQQRPRLVEDLDLEAEQVADKAGKGALVFAEIGIEQHGIGVFEELRNLRLRQLVFGGTGQLQKRRVSEDFTEFGNMPGVTFLEDFDRMGFCRGGCAHFL